MKRMNPALAGMALAGLLYLFTLGCAEEKTTQPMGTKMETMQKGPVQPGMGSMEKPEMQQEMSGSMHKKKSM